MTVPVDTLAADLAVLRDAISRLMIPDYQALAAVDRVEARATQAEADLIYQTRESQGRERRRLAAEAEAARLLEEQARLREERDAANNLLEGLTVACEGWKLDCRAAEARCARLQQALEAIAEDDELVHANEGAFSVHAYRRCVAQAQAALAGPDTPADRQQPRFSVDPVHTLCGFAHGPFEDCPADSQPEETTT